MKQYNKSQQPRSHTDSSSQRKQAKQATQARKQQRHNKRIDWSI